MRRFTLLPLLIGACLCAVGFLAGRIPIGVNDIAQRPITEAEINVVERQIAVARDELRAVGARVDEYVREASSRSSQSLPVATAQQVGNYEAVYREIEALQGDVSKLERLLIESRERENAPNYIDGELLSQSKEQARSLYRSIFFDDREQSDRRIGALRMLRVLRESPDDPNLVNAVAVELRRSTEIGEIEELIDAMEGTHDNIICDEVLRCLNAYSSDKLHLPAVKVLREFKARDDAMRAIGAIASTSESPSARRKAQQVLDSR